MQTHDNETGITTYTDDRFDFNFEDHSGKTISVRCIENGDSKRSVTQVYYRDYKENILVGFVINHLTIVNITGHGRDYIHDQGKLHAARETFGWTLAEPGTLLTKAGDWRSSCEQVVKAYLSSKAE